MKINQRNQFTLDTMRNSSRSIILTVLMFIFAVSSVGAEIFVFKTKIIKKRRGYHYFSYIVPRMQTPHAIGNYSISIITTFTIQNKVFDTNFVKVYTSEEMKNILKKRDDKLIELISEKNKKLEQELQSLKAEMKAMRKAMIDSMRNLPEPRD